MPFKNGQSGNPGGRAKEFEFKRALGLALAKDGDRQKRLVSVAEKLVEQAEKGEAWAIREVADRLDGKPAQAVTVGGDAENPLELTVTAVMERIDGKSRALPNGRSVDGPALEAEQPLHDNRQEGE